MSDTQADNFQCLAELEVKQIETDLIGAGSGREFNFDHL